MIVGQRVRNLDWDCRTTGLGKYTSDLRLPGMLVAKVLRSPYPHARIRAIDVSKAGNSPGVAAVITAADVDVFYIHHGGPLSDRQPLAKEHVRFCGEEVAAVAAETPEQAEAALRLIRVEFEPLPFVETIAEALQPEAPALHDRKPGRNVSLVVNRQYGDVDKGKQKTQLTVSGTYHFGRQAHACMETNSVLAHWHADEKRLELWTSTQAPYFIQKEVAHALGLDRSQVVIHEVAVGGGFGSKSKISEHEVIAAALSVRAGRPVRLVLTRNEEFSTTKCRHDFVIRLTTGVDQQGRLTFREANMLVDNGAYNHTGPSVMGYGCLVMGSLYRTDGVSIKASLVDTNKHPGGQFRGYGGPQATFPIECQMDELAEKLGIDPIDFRIQNANRVGDISHAGWQFTSVRVAECLQAVRQAIQWDEKRKQGGRGRGVGVAIGVHVTSAHVYEKANESEAEVDICPGGRVRVRFGGADSGTWQNTLLSQIAAEELAVDLSQIDILSMDSETTPVDMGAWSSRGTFMGGHAVSLAARAAAQELRRLAAQIWRISPEAVQLKEGAAIYGEEKISYVDLLPLAKDLQEGELRIQRTFVANVEPMNRETGISNLSPTYSFAAHAVEVQVDRDTGQVQVLKVIAAHDSGKALNPIGMESQIVGGVAMGLGAALSEELLYERGRMVNPAYVNYALPRAADVPEIQPIVLNFPDPVGPYGAKGIGEIALVPTAAAVANAVYHAIGVRVRELPITPDKVLKALREREGRAPRRFALWWRPSRWFIALMRWAYPRGIYDLLDRRPAESSSGLDQRSIEKIERSSNLQDAIAALQKPGSAMVAGATDLLPACQQGLIKPTTLVDVSAVADLYRWEETAEHGLFMGAGWSLAEIARRLGRSGDHALCGTIAEIASPQVREMATLGGNLCQQKRCWFYRNGFHCYKRGGFMRPCYAVLGDHRFYHAAMDAHRCQAVTPSDLATTLAALDASAEIVGKAGSRKLAIADFYKGPGEPRLASDEILTGVYISASARQRLTQFEKLKLWQGDFAVASACVSVRLGRQGSVEDCRVVLGAIAPTPWRAQAVEAKLQGKKLTLELIHAVSECWISQAHPLEGNVWKLDAAAGLLRRCLHKIELRVNAAGTQSAAG